MVRNTIDSLKLNWSGLIYEKPPANSPPPKPPSSAERAQSPG